jgi:hypothetical protein
MGPLINEIDTIWKIVKNDFEEFIENNWKYFNIT